MKKKSKFARKQKTTPIPKKIKVLSLSNCTDADLHTVTNYPKIERLDLSLSGITHVSPLVHLQHIRRLSLEGTAVVDLSPLLHLGKLQRLSLMGCHSIQDFEPLIHLDIPELRIAYADDKTDRYVPVYEGLPACYKRSKEAMHDYETMVQYKEQWKIQFPLNNFDWVGNMFLGVNLASLTGWACHNL
jgi:hypothetical protein